MAIDILNVSMAISPEHYLLRDLSARLNRGELTVIIGPNGAGKSSLLKVIANEVKHSSLKGYVTIFGKKNSEWNIGQLARQFAYLPQASLLNFPFRVEEVVALGRIPHATSKRDNDSIIQQSMTLTDVDVLRDHLYPQLSGGEKQRVHLARAFAQIWPNPDGEDRVLPRFLLLDEPTTALDIGHQHALMAQIKSMSKNGVGVLVVMHDFSLAAQYADRIIAMQAGSIIADGCVEDVFSDQLIAQLFNVKAHIFNDSVTGKAVVATSPLSHDKV